MSTRFSRLGVLCFLAAAGFGSALFADVEKAQERARQGQWRGALRALDEADRSFEALLLRARANNELGRVEALEWAREASATAGSELERARAQVEVAVAVAQQRPLDGQAFEELAAELRGALAGLPLGWADVRARWCDARTRLPTDHALVLVPTIDPSVKPAARDGSEASLAAVEGDLSVALVRHAELPSGLKAKLPFQLDPIVVVVDFDADGCATRVGTTAPPGDRVARGLAQAHASLVAIPRFGSDGRPEGGRVQFSFGGTRYPFHGSVEGDRLDGGAIEAWHLAVANAEKLARAGDYEKAETAATRVIDEIRAVPPGSGILGQVLGLAHLVRALAAAHREDNDLAAWEHGLARAFYPPVERLDLTPYGLIGQRLQGGAAADAAAVAAAVPSDSDGVVIDDPKTLISHQLPKTRPVAPGPGCHQIESRVRWVIGVDGTVSAPRITSPESDPVSAEGIFALVAAHRFAPPRCGAEPCSVDTELHYFLTFGDCPPRQRSRE